MGTVTQFVTAALSQIGKPYVYGGDTPAVGFDCSGLVYWAAAQAGEPVPRTTSEEWTGLTAVTVPRYGDLIEYDVAGDPPPQPSHVMIYLDADHALEAPHTGTTVRIVSPIPNSPTERIMGYRRISFTPTPGPTPAPAPPEVPFMSVSPLISFRPGQTDVVQVSETVVWHKWRIAGVWENENLVQVLGLEGAKFASTPKTSVVNGQLNVTVEATTGAVYLFAQGQTGGWGVNRLP